MVAFFTVIASGAWLRRDRIKRNANDERKHHVRDWCNRGNVRGAVTYANIETVAARARPGTTVSVLYKALLF